jgi:uncharacterized membrane protein
MDRRRADAAVAVLVGAVLLAGSALTWQAYQQRRAVDGTMMDGSMAAMHGPNPLYPAVGTLFVVAVLGGAYLLVRGEIAALGEASGGSDGASNSSAGTATTAGDGDAAVGGASESPPRGTELEPPEAEVGQRVLDVLPEDERRILEPVVSSPGVTQIALRDRSGFSKSKVSQTVSDLEARGLLYRERQGRTYRVYPSDELLAGDVDE